MSKNCDNCRYGDQVFIEPPCNECIKVKKHIKWESKLLYILKCFLRGKKK